MTRVLVCVPVNEEQAAQIADGRALAGPLQAFSVTAELLDAFGLQPADDEPAEYAALLMAGLWALQHYGRRLVVTAQVPGTLLAPGAETANGGLSLSELAARSVEAWFADESDVPSDLVARQISGLGLDEAWETDAVQRLHAEHDLLWHSVVELGKD